MPRTAIALAGAVAAALLTACSGNGCDRLPELTQQRDAARADYAELTSSGTATTEQTEQADAGVSLLDAQVYELEQSCG